MYNSNQLRSLYRIFSYALFIFILLNVFMWVSTTLAPGVFWVPKQFFGVDFVKENYQRVQGAKAYYRDPVNTKEDPLIVLLGLSSASEGISIKQLQKNTRDRGDNNTQFLSLSGAGRNFKEIDIYAAPLINSTLDPTLIIIAINPFHLMDPQLKPVSLWQVIAQTPRHEFLTGWFKSKRDDLRHLLDMKILNIRSNLFSLLDNRVDEKGIDPWRESTFMGIPALTATEQWQYKLQEYGKRGYYKIENYQNSTHQPLVLVKLIKQLAEKKTKLLILLMPEHTSLYESIPNAAMQVLLGKLRMQLPEGQLPEIVNMRQVISDDGFNDISHMNERGRELFTNMLERVIMDARR